ncbi:2162_t:CDS:2 [Paraglomus brasilianum]|uniref:2162_t:CDS:1 n=1 Tax=Paraglomus brasilianum TaxID=144538 RepID=A0A9N8ZKD8_9GLOM|nr:2162_t:CDS:2 [Paraglomus brasilianum]
MKWHIITWLLLGLLILPKAIAWTKEDYEIFDLVDELETEEGEETTFYSWLGLEPTATEKEISKAYRKLYLQLHPDKNPDARSNEKFARLGLIAGILRNPESKERYDWFLKNGVPRWRGTGYYYSRYQPGLLTVLAFLVVLVSTVQYIVFWITFVQDKKRIRYYIHRAREIAWGKTMKKQMTTKRVTVNDVQFYVYPDYVALSNEDGRVKLDENDVSKPRIFDVFVFAIFKWLFTIIFGKVFRKNEKEMEDSKENDSTNEGGESFSSDDEQSSQSEPKRRVRSRNKKGRRARN